MFLIKSKKLNDENFEMKERDSFFLTDKIRKEKFKYRYGFYSKLIKKFSFQIDQNSK